MSPPANVGLVRRSLEAFLRGDVDEALSDTDPNIVAHRVAPLPDAQTYHGRDGILQMWTDWTEDFADFEMTIGECLEIGDHEVVVEIFQRGTGIESGARVEGRFWFLYTLDAGKVIGLDAFISRKQALEAIEPVS